MYVLSEEAVRKLATPDLAFNAVRDAFIAIYRQQGVVFPVVIAHGSDPLNTFSIKSGTSISAPIVGVKVGSYWPKNYKVGLSNHGTTTVLLDDKTGKTKAVISAGYLNGLRTAAANAVATSILSRENSQTLAVIGAGHQALFEARAIHSIRKIERILISSRNPDRAASMASELADLNCTIEVADIKTACQAADIITTVTPARAPLLEAKWIKPGTHISAMGADASGKMELPIDLVLSSTLFADLPQQSKAIGEFENAAKSSPDIYIRPIGAVLVGDTPGRTSETEVTIFDSSGIALQDLFVADIMLAKALTNGLAQHVEF